MLRREFLQSLAAFAAAAAAGGTVAKAGFTPPARPAEPRVALWTPPSEPAVPTVSTVGRLDIELVRGDDFVIDIDCALRVGSAVICKGGSDSVGAAAFASVASCGLPPGSKHLFTNTVCFASSDTMKLRPGRKMWAVSFVSDGYSVRHLIGKATILPDAFWKSQEEVLGWLPRMHALGVERPRGSRVEQVWFRERLRPDERSIEDGRVAAILTHSRPVGATIINRGAGCVINFAKEELL
jgi:hypothetical protein